MILGREGIHKWVSADGVEVELNRLKDTVGVPVRPYVRLREAGLASLGDATDNRDARVGADGEIPRTSHRRGKTVPYEGVIRAGSARELRAYQAELRAAFANRSDEGQMEVFPHELNPEFDTGEGRSLFHARVLGLEMLDVRDTQRFESTFVLALRMSDARYFERLTAASLKAAILELEPALYWALDAADGATDLSGNGRDGTAQGGLVVGAGPRLTPVSGDSSSDLDGTNDRITSSYNPFAAGSKRTFLGVARRDASTSADTLFGAAGVDLGLSIAADSFDPDTVFWTPDGTGVADWDAAWADPGIPQPWALVHEDDVPSAGSSRASLYLSGDLVSQETSVDYASTGNVQAGMTNASTAPFDGKLAHFAVFDRALSEEEIESVHLMLALGIRSRW